MRGKKPETPVMQQSATPITQQPANPEPAKQRPERKPTNPVFSGMARNSKDFISYVDLGRRHPQNQIGPPRGTQERRGVRAKAQGINPQKVYEFEIETRHHNEVGIVGSKAQAGNRRAFTPATGPQFKSKVSMTTRRKKDLDAAGVKHSRI